MASEEEEDLWRRALASQKIVSNAIPATQSLVSAISSGTHTSGEQALLVDSDRLAAEGVAPAQLGAWLAKKQPNLALLLYLGQRVVVHEPELCWARINGIHALIPGVAPAAWRESLLPALNQVAECIGEPKPDAVMLEQIIRILHGKGTEGVNANVTWTHSAIQRLESIGADMSKLAAQMQDAGSVEVRDRTYRLKPYRSCFIGSEAVDWMASHLGTDRDTAVVAGDVLRRLGYLHHSVREQPFRDGNFYYRFSQNANTSSNIDLNEIARSMRAKGGIHIADREYRGKAYPKCFIGSDAVDWLCRNFQLGVGEAEGVGQSLIDLGVLHHVVDEHGFCDANFYYRFRADEVRA